MSSMRPSMVDNTVRRPLGVARPSNRHDLLAQSVFAAFLILIFVGLTPFPSSESLASGLIATGEGDLTRQISYLVAFVVVIGLAFATRGQLALRAFPVPLAIVLIWCLLSIGWAIAPDIAARRATLTIILSCCVMFSVDMLGVQRSLQVLRFVLAAILIVNCISLLFIPQAVHLPGELEVELTGDWRGMHGHKNIAGPIAALSALLFYHFGLATRRWSDWILFLMAVVFLIGTQSKTAIGFFVLSIVVSTTCRQMCRTESGRRFFVGLFVFALLLTAGLWIFAFDTFAELLSDPTQFTGRVAIWQTVLSYVREHPILGAGFGSFWGIGEASPVKALSPYEKWIEIIPHSHNGYLEILVTTGSIGLFLSVVAFVIIPLKQLLGRNGYDIELRSLLLSFFTFIVFSNLLETIFLSRDLSVWIVFLIVLAVLHQMSVKGVSNVKLSSSRKQP
jgi:exopolysaccharide production protein ExoQ